MQRIIHSTLTLTVALFALFAPSLVLAGHCFDPQTGSYPDSLHLPNGECPAGTPDPGSFGVTSGGGGGDDDKGILYLIGVAGTVVVTIVPFIIALAVLVILWGIFKYLSGVGDEEKRQEARLFVIWGIIGIFVMVSIWGLVNILRNTFQLNNTAPGVGSIFPTQD